MSCFEMHARQAPAAIASYDAEPVSMAPLGHRDNIMVQVGTLRGTLLF